MAEFFGIQVAQTSRLRLSRKRQFLDFSCVQEEDRRIIGEKLFKWAVFNRDYGCFSADWAQRLFPVSCEPHCRKRIISDGKITHDGIDHR